MRTELQKFEERFEAVTESGCWIWTGALWSHDRYGCFRGKESAHKASLRLYKGKPTTKDEHVCHTCDVTLCVNPDHLYVGSTTSNTADKVKRGRLKVALQKLGEAEVQECIRLRKAGMKVKDIAILYGLSDGQMSRITRGHRTYFNPDNYKPMEK